VSPNIKGVATIYRLTRLHSTLRGGANQAVDAEIRGVAKTNNLGPYTIANEVVAARLAHGLGLPVPAGVVAEHTGQLFYLSLDVSKEGKTLPPIVPNDFVVAEPWLAAGVVVFDIWTANGDRHANNISFDPGFSPPRPAIFDHGHALLGTADPKGPDRLQAANDDLGCTGKGALGGNREVLLDLVSSAQDLRAWTERVSSLPDFVVKDACADARELGLLSDDGTRDALDTWLQRRKPELWRLISNHQDEFPAIGQWELEGETP
jgi:hypothetical protein